MFFGKYNIVMIVIQLTFIAQLDEQEKYEGKEVA